MATENVNETQTFNFGNGSGLVSLCLGATYQIDALSQALLNAAYVPDIDELPYLTQGIVARIKDLNAIIMTALGDDGTSESEISNRMGKVAHHA